MYEKKSIKFTQKACCASGRKHVYCFYAAPIGFTPTITEKTWFNYIDDAEDLLKTKFIRTSTVQLNDTIPASENDEGYTCKRRKTSEKRKIGAWPQHSNTIRGIKITPSILKVSSLEPSTTSVHPHPLLKLNFCIGFQQRQQNCFYPPPMIYLEAIKNQISVLQDAITAPLRY